ncbi:hypothetical protein [Neorickettsia sennetsu]|uniref:Uncharacterized protein n=1 Tax=Ehrlichia sennetsu (strain ATCC VR-367 / Miyayama) TaxID=222891 RepID=Q2GE35_EHRS3|nr:hypothetical protein [Neorickettsia sennetsu]ABD46002.1 hypothetical protein NSE_0372 [Neorickettsia sennetsu str. Miyayama]
MSRVFNEGEKGKIVQFLSHPNLLQLFSDYVFIKCDVVERLAIEENDENINAIFLLLFAGIFIKQRDDISDVFSAVVLNYSGPEDAGFFVGKEKYLLKGLLKLVAEEFFFPSVGTVPHEKVRSFAELFSVVLRDDSTSTDLPNDKEATVQICFKVLMQLSRYQDAIDTDEGFDPTGTLHNLANLYDAISEGSISLQEFYLCYENGMLSPLHSSALLSRITNFLHRIPGLKLFVHGVRYFTNWIKNIW